MIADWTVPFDITSPYGPMTLNEISALGCYRLRAPGCKIALPLRQTTSFIPQADGAIPHRRFLGGVSMLLPIQMWADDSENGPPACDDQLQDMLDYCQGVFRSLLNAGDNEGRIAWLPSGQAERMLDDVRLFVYPIPSYVEGTLIVEVGVTIDTKYPYAEDLTQTETNVSGTTVLTNGGNADFWPVWKVNGPFSTFTLLNNTTGEQIEYDAGQPGAASVAGGHYAEIDTFGGTIFLDGNSTDLSAGIVELNSDDFPLIPGANSITLTGAPSADALYQAAWG